MHRTMQFLPQISQVKVGAKALDDVDVCRLSAVRGRFCQCICSVFYVVRFDMLESATCKTMQVFI